MKKIVVFAMSAIMLTLASCTNKNVKDVKLKEAIDTVSYAIGYQNGEQIMFFLPQQGRLDTANISKFQQGLLDAIYLKENADKEYEMGYQIGTEMRSSLKGAFVVPGDSSSCINKDAFVAGMIDVFSKNGAKISVEDADAIIQDYVVSKRRTSAGDYIKKQEDFLSENAKKEGVVTLPSGLQYKVITEGNGEVPTENQTVRVNYTGTLIDGTKFDSSYDRNEPFEFNTSGGVIPAWLEISKMMPVGSKWVIYAPEYLAYGDREAGKIPAFSTLIFEIEMLEIVK